MLDAVTLVLGGARSGKSGHAEALVQAHPAPWRYLATAEAGDDEMRARIAAHQARRPPGWHTAEVPLDLPGALAAAGPMPVLVDCLTLWLTNVMLGDHDVARATDALLDALAARPAATVLVSNEVGLGIVPEHALAAASATRRAAAPACGWRVGLRRAHGGRHRDEGEMSDDAARHRDKMAHRKAVQDAEVAAKTIEKGLLIVHTGPGKGKSTAAFGLALRMIGHGRPVGVVQFVKGAWSTGERTVLERFRRPWSPGTRWARALRGRPRTATATSPPPDARWAMALELMQRRAWGCWCSTSSTSRCATAISTRRRCWPASPPAPPALHVAITGRNARPALLEAADLVTEMVATKHHFAAGVKAQQGIEF